jgi:hypothetical protein
VPSELGHTTDVGLGVRGRAAQVDYRLTLVGRDELEMSLLSSLDTPPVPFSKPNNIGH